ncbi:MAG: TIR domain-containing protein [Bacteroidales bacterium]|nr:TIR domain-containing protein [Bacteroidales bacterium]MBR0299096.1 TIR domain-containing protein [Bacteroidales bacterium]
MKVFLSWSGHKSHQVALVFRDWLPSVIQSINPYVSSEDIDKGARWSTDIAKELEDSTFGILCVTKENLEAPWLLFEAGALSKMMDKSSVCPFIFDLKRAEVKGPILQFQSTIFEKEDVKKLLMTLNKSCGEAGLKEELLSKTFEVWWPNLEESLTSIKSERSEEEKDISDKNLNNEILEEILELSRTNQKILRSPEILLPPEYFDFIVKEKLDKDLSERERELLSEQRHLLMEVRHRTMMMHEMVSSYRIEKRVLDDEFYEEFRRYIDLLQRHQMSVDKTYKIMNRKY